MQVIRLLIVWIGKAVLQVSRVFRLGAGATWPGEVALSLDPNIFQHFVSRFSKGIILVAGTNGKTTTALMIKTILEASGERVVHNTTGANLLNGIVSACLDQADRLGRIDAHWGVFEVDENALAVVMSSIKYQVSSGKQKLILVLLNLFRDQLDRYGEVDVIAEKWEKALRQQYGQSQQGQKDSKTSQENTIQIIANADDPLIAHLAKAVNSGPGPALPAGRLERGVWYFGLNKPSLFQKNIDHASDSTFCLNCGARLTYDGIYFSHLGIWSCTKCGEKRPKPNIYSGESPLPGLYNLYNTLATMSVAKILGIKSDLAGFHPAFGRQEDIGNIKIFLSKNPVGFNQSLRTVMELGARNVLLVLNDRIPDGRDVSWIWDVDFEILPAYITPVVSGDRAYDLALRLKYAKPYHKLPKGAVSEPQTPILVYEDLTIALDFCLRNLNIHETLYILPTYSAMLEVRKILIGKKILN